MKSVIVIGDVHGCYKTLMKLIEQLPKDVPICFAGDLIDRGPQSKDVVEYVKNNHLCVRGNHEQMMIDNAGSWDFYSDWAIYNGGRDTIESYDPDNDFRLFDEHTKWMSELPLYIEFKDVKNAEGRHLVVSHSSVGKVWDWSEEKRQQQKGHFENNIMWDRNPPEDQRDIYNIFGHTPQKNGARVKSFYANVDTGCVFKGRGDYGRLTAIEFPSMKLFTQENIENE